MRSSNKTRSRKSGGRSRNIGNVVNRVFESAGPEGKVRGTPQQIIEKYQGLARDAQLSNDRVAAENFQQHAEHYTRLLDDAQRDQAERQAAEDRKRQAQQSQNVGGGDGPDEARDDTPAPPPAAASGPEGASRDVLGQEQDGDADLVDTPESAGKRQSEEPRKPRARSRRPAPKPKAGADQNGEGKQAAEPPYQ